MTGAMAREAYVADRFDRLRERFPVDLDDEDPRWLAVAESLGNPAGRRVLDLGCGRGRFARRLIEAGATVLGVDRARGMLGDAKGVDRLRATARRLPLASACFDLVLMIEVLQHLGEPGPALAEARRVLRPGGVLLVIDRNPWAPDPRRPWLPAVVIKEVDTWRGRWMYPAWGPARERWFGAGRLSRLLGRHFEAVETGLVAGGFLRWRAS